MFNVVLLEVFEKFPVCVNMANCPAILPNLIRMIECWLLAEKVIMFQAKGGMKKAMKRGKIE